MFVVNLHVWDESFAWAYNRFSCCPKGRGNLPFVPCLCSPTVPMFPAGSLQQEFLPFSLGAAFPGRRLSKENWRKSWFGQFYGCSTQMLDSEDARAGNVLFCFIWGLKQGSRVWERKLCLISIEALASQGTIVCKCLIEYKRMGLCLYMCVLNFLANNSSISWQSMSPSWPHTPLSLYKHPGLHRCMCVSQLLTLSVVSKFRI